MRRFADAAEFDIGAFVESVRHVRRRQVRQCRQQLVELPPQLGRAAQRRLLRLLALRDLGKQRIGQLAAFLGGTDLARQPVAHRLRLLGGGLQGPPFPVDRQYLRGPRRQPAPRQTPVEFVGVFPDPSQIVHEAGAAFG